MKRQWWTVGLLSLALGGCVILTDREDYDRDGDVGGWQQAQRHNRAVIADLTLGAAYDEVTAQLGQAAFSEAFERDGHRYRVLRYRTQHRHADGRTTEDETTPLVFQDGLLIGWGESLAARVAP